MGSKRPDPTVLPTACRRTCMVCGSRPGGLVLADCVLCEGAGVVALGPAAVTMGAEAAGMQVYEVLSPYLWPKFHKQEPVDDDRIAAVVEELVEAGYVRRLPETLYAHPLRQIDPGALGRPDEVAAARDRRQ